MLSYLRLRMKAAKCPDSLMALSVKLKLHWDPLMKYNQDWSGWRSTNHHTCFF